MPITSRLVAPTGLRVLCNSLKRGRGRMDSRGTGVDELDPMEAIQHDVNSAMPDPSWVDRYGMVHNHPVHPECGPECVHEPGWDGVPHEIDSEDGPPPRHGGPTT